MEWSFFMLDLRTQLHWIAAFVSTATCGEGAGSDGADCRDEATALRLKTAAVTLILAASAAGVAVPLVGRDRCLGGSGSGTFSLIKAFSAGVVLATGFVHVLNEAQEALSDPCLPEAPWRRFPFAGFVAMLAALGTLAVDLICTQFYERKLKRGQQEADASEQHEAAALLRDSGLALEATTVARWDGVDDATMHVAGTSAHASGQTHSYSPRHVHSMGEAAHDGRGHDEESSLARRVVVAQILELGIVSHSVIIGLSLGVSHSPCTIKPLVAALSFRQFFEGFALGGCISEAQFNNFLSFLMAFFFAVTTPAGIILGMGIAPFYNSNSPRALLVEGILDSLSAGILIYMALVDLIAADFLNQRISYNLRFQLGLYIALFLGAFAMSAMVIWT